VARVLVTGMSGTGKSTVLEELRRHGYYTAKSGQAPNEESLWQVVRAARDPGIGVYRISVLFCRGFS
jgi:dephospho-CoA kinase